MQENPRMKMRGGSGDDNCVVDLEDKTKSSSRESLKRTDRSLDMFPCGKMNWEAIGWSRTASNSYRENEVNEKSKATMKSR